MKSNAIKEVVVMIRMDGMDGMDVGALYLPIYSKNDVGDRYLSRCDECSKFANSRRNQALGFAELVAMTVTVTWVAS